MSAVELLHTTTENESYAINGRSVVIGGGNVAIDVARTNTRCGASEVSMFCLESRDEMPAADEEVAEALEEGVNLQCGWGPKEILTENGKVTGVVLKNVSPSRIMTEGSTRPLTKTIRSPFHVRTYI